METRQCRACGETKPLNTESFHYNRSRKIFETRCKVCVNTAWREKYANNPEWRAEKIAYQKSPAARARKNELRRERYRADPEYRGSLLAAQKEKYATDEDYRERVKARERTKEVRERQNTRQRERWATDPDYRERMKAYIKTPEAKAARNARSRERRANDPDYRDRIKALRSTTKARERDRARLRVRRATDPDYRKKSNDRDRERYHNSPRKQQLSDRSLLKRYGITRADYDRMSAEQSYRCAICGQETADALHVDHNHQTKQVRGLLCENCNFGVGLLAENPEAMAKAIAYLNLPPVPPQDILPIPAERLFARFEIPHWERQSRDKTYRTRRHQNLRHTLGISIDQYEALLEKGNGVCWICQLPETQKSNEKSLYPNALSVDHNHQTGMIRGLLCSKCNFGIGHLKDVHENLAKAIEYLKRWENMAC